METRFTPEVMEEMEYPTDRAEIDPLTLALIGKVISLVVVHLVKNCILDKKMANAPSFFQKARLNRLVHRIGRQEGLDRDKRQRAGNALLKKGTKMTQDDIARVISEAGTT